MKRKKLLSIVMAVALCLCSLPLTAVQAQKSLETFSEEEPLKKNETEEFEELMPELTPQEGNVKAAGKIGEEYSYVELEDGTLEIMSYFGNDTELVVPTEIDGKRVTSIGDRAFSRRSSLTSIKLPESLTSVDWSVFSECSNLKEIIVDGNNVNYTSKDGILYDKNQIELICCPMGKVGNIVILASVSRIGDSAFSGCKSLKSIKLPEGVNEIGSGAFSDCSSLKSIELSEGVAEIGSGAFYDCRSLESIKLPASVSRIGDSAFSGCKSLKGIELPKGVNDIESSVFEDCNSLEGIELPEGVNEIKNFAFRGCSRLKSIKLPTSVNKIGRGAFYDCNNLTSIELPEGVNEIENSVFRDCNRLTSIKLPASVSSIGEFAFSGCKSLTSIELPESVNEIGGHAFSGCSSLKSIKLPASLSSMPKGIDEDENYSVYVPAFSGCSSLKEINVDENNANYESKDGILYEKGQKYLIYCPQGKVGDIVIPASVNEIGSGAFLGCNSLTSIELPENLSKIRSSAFSGCSSLTSIELPESVNEIGYSVFEDCSNLTSIELPESVNEIGSSAFSGCSKLTSIKLPVSLNRIDWYAFSGCSSLTSIELPASVNEIGSFVFEDCSNLTEINVDGNNVNYESKDGILYDKNQTKLICCPQGKAGDIVIPASVTSVGESAFSGCSSLTEINVDSNNANYTSKDGILYDKNQTELICCPQGKAGDVVIPASVTSIEGSAFSGCSSLKSIELPEGLTSIRGYAFEGCSSLTSIELPASLSSLQKRVVEEDVGNGKWNYRYSPVFSGCSNLSEISVDENNANYESKDGILYEKGQKYLICCPEGKTGDIVIPEGVIRISGFSDCSRLTSIELPASLSSLPKDVDGSEYVPAFSGCSSLKEINVDGNNTNYESEDGILYEKGLKYLICCPQGKAGDIVIPASVTIIGRQAFIGCSKLTSIELQEGVSGIWWGAFTNCSSLSEIKLPESLTSIMLDAFSGCSNLTLLVYKDSYAETYALEEGLTYRYIDDSKDCSHIYKKVIVKATTKKNGSITQTCTKCGEQTKEIIYAAKTIKLSKTVGTYNRKNQKPSVTVKYSKKKTLKNKKDYAVTYPKAMKNVGSYTITIKLKGNYKGTVKKTFQIIPKGTQISKITPKKRGFALKWKKQTVQTTGYEIVYSTNKKFTKKTTETITIGKNKAVSITVSKLKARKKYYVKVRTYKTIKLNGKSKKLYSVWSKRKTVKIKK